MGVLTMNMSGYEVEHGDVATSEYDDEVMCAGWIPTLALRESHPQHQQVEMPDSLAMVDAETFLRRMYSCQR